MIQLHCDVNQLNIGKSMGVLHLFAWNYVNFYAYMEGYRRDRHIYNNRVKMNIPNIGIQI